MQILQNDFFARDTVQVAKELLGKVIFHKYYITPSKSIWLKAQIIETEAYLMTEKASHSSLGYTEKKKALFMPAGTIYMYYSRGKDSFNISTDDDGDAVLIKAGIPYIKKTDKEADAQMIAVMKKLNPINGRERETMRLCSGQTLIARSLNLKLIDWNQKQFSEDKLFIAKVKQPSSAGNNASINTRQIICTRRLGIPKGRDDHLMYRFVDSEFKDFCTKNPLKSTHTIE